MRRKNMDPEEKKGALRLMTYGLYVMTAHKGDETAAGAFNWLSQASFKPPLVMAAVKADSHLHALIEQTGLFAVNVLSSSQKDLAAAFFRPAVIEGGLINGYKFEAGGDSGAPWLVDAPACFEARVADSVKGGDHTVIVAEVINAKLRDPQAKALTMWNTGWYYGG
jgi:flavin reductase (DIM6/NTAB) family NADH-FMN oxidoreductase RutF